MDTSPSSILVVDDERHVRSAMMRVLRRMDFDPFEAASGEEALSAIEAGRQFSCALVDLRMPGMGGIEFARRSRAVQPEMPVIIVTGNGDVDDARQLSQLGVADFVMKPWNNAELQLAITRAMQARALQPRAATPGAAAARSHPDLLRLGARAVDALRSGPLPARAAPPLGFGGAEIWRGGAGAARAMGLLAATDADCARRARHVASFDLGAAPADLAAAAVALGPDRSALAVALAAVWRMHDEDAVPATRRDDVRRAFCGAQVRAAAMRTAAENLPHLHVSPRRAHLAGLFADVGAIILTTELASRGVSWAEAAAFAAEQHGPASGWIASEWSLPGECVLACAQHHLQTPLYGADPLPLLLWACEESVLATSGWSDPAALPHGANAARLAGVTADVRAEIERACRDSRVRFEGTFGAIESGRAPPAPLGRIA